MPEEEEMREGRGRLWPGGCGDAAGFYLEHTSVFDIHFSNPLQGKMTSRQICLIC